ncbi:MAG: tetratricopeptide repeat protein [Bacteroidia bacterium]|nr:tetratricopeptide repeat protein [Bacteroidia bacterium]
MTLIKIFTLILLTICLCINIYGQNNKIDSLLQLLKKDKPDTSKIIHLNDLSWEYRSIGSYDSAMHYANAALQFSTVILNETVIPSEARNLIKQIAQKGIANAYSNIGIVYHVQGDYPKAIEYALKALKIYEELNDKKGRAALLGNIGIVYHVQGDYPNALDYYFKALKIREELGNKRGIASGLGNIGIVYKDQGDYPNALVYYFKALKTYEELRDKNGIATVLGNIGNVYLEQGDYSKVYPVESDSLFNRALDYYFKVLKIREELGDKNGIATVLGNIGNVYADQARTPKVYLVESDFLFNRALEYYFKALKMAEELGNKNGIAIWLGNIGSLYTKTGKFQEAEQYLKRAIAIDDSIGTMNGLRQDYELLSQLYDTIGRYKLSLIYYKKAMVLKDTLFNIDRHNKMVRKEMTYQFEKKQASEKAEQDKKAAVAKEQSRRQKLVILFVVCGLLLALVFTGFIYRSLRITRKQKRIIEAINKDINDSINYALTIQLAMLPFEELISQSLKEFFIIYKPKAVVSGDFYWFSEVDGKQIIAAADCTGHGVPGAFVSMLGNDLLNHIVNVRKILRSDLILNELHNGIRYALKQEETQNKDGMDIALVVIDKKNGKLQYSGAKNPLVYILNNELFVVKADKLYIGGSQQGAEQERIFKLNEIELSSPMFFYLFTDGIQDQFGGPKGKKFMLKQLQQLFFEHHHKPVNEQKEILDKSFENWKGEHEQIDDVTILGIRI